MRLKTQDSRFKQEVAQARFAFRISNLEFRRGFTLIELLVAIAVFSIVMLVGVGALLSMVGANHKAQAIQSVMNNLNYAVESMGRSIPVGTNYHCGSVGILTSPRDCIEGDTYFVFRSYDGKQITYRFTENRIERAIDAEAFVAITAPEVILEEAKFYVRGTTQGDSDQPQVVIRLKGYAGINERVRSNFALQTTVTQRLLDL